MNNALTTSVNPITEGQQDLITRGVEDGRKKALRVIQPDNPAAQRIIARMDEFQDALIDKMRELSLELPEIPCFGIADWQKLYGVTLTPKQIASVANFPWSEAVLNAPCPFNPSKMIHETHFVFVGLDTVSIVELQKLNPMATEPRFASYAPNSWYSKQDFATIVKLKFRWYLLLKEIVPGSENKTFEDQKKILPKEYEVPMAVEEAAKDILVFKKTGIYVNSNRYARTNTLDSLDVRVLVGLCDAGGVRIYFIWGDDPYSGVGIGASRKFK